MSFLSPQKISIIILENEKVLQLLLTRVGDRLKILFLLEKEKSVVKVY